jgi:hypothetical protein
MLYQSKIEKSNSRDDVVYLLSKVDYQLTLTMSFRLNLTFANRLGCLPVEINRYCFF